MHKYSVYRLLQMIYSYFHIVALNIFIPIKKSSQKLRYIKSRIVLQETANFILNYGDA